MEEYTGGGLIADPRTTEEKMRDLNFVQLAAQLNKVYRDVDWNLYKPIGRPQSFINNGVFFDTMSCTSYSFNQVVEMQLNYLYTSNKLTEKKKLFLEENGYIQNGKVYFSDRFIAIMSGTTDEGNYFQKVCDTGRNVGLIPNSMFPDGGNTFAQYHNKNLITEEMKTLAGKFRNLFDISYGWLYSDDIPGFSQPETKIIEEALRYAPVQIGVPIKANHAILMYDMRATDYASFDHYIPFDRPNDSRPVNFYMSIYVTEKNSVYPKYTFTKNLTIGAKGNDVKVLQEILIIEECLAPGLNTGNYGKLTREAVKKFQEKYKSEILTPVGLSKGTGLFYNSTRAFINNLIK